ncbi:MAG: ATP-binding protein [Planctomycetota bacterium]
MTPPTAPATPSVESLTASDLAEMFEAFNDVTSKLQGTHERLTGEVARLQGELRRANDELERSRRLAALGEMAAGIAHEVRNPLGSIGLYAEMLAADLPEGDARLTATKIVRAVHGLDAVVGDVLAFSREMRIEPERLAAGEIFTDALDACRDVLAGSEIRASRGCEVQVDADPVMLRQALVNVIRNAAEAVDRKGTIGLSAAAGETPQGDAAAVLSISDTGPGILSDVRERMFNPFFTTRAVGTGLGLAIVHRIVDAHGGVVRVHNREPAPGDPGGATIEIVLPKAASQNAHDPRNAA